MCRLLCDGTGCNVPVDLSLLQLIDGDDDVREDDKSITPWMHYTIIGSYIHPTSLAACSTTPFPRLPSLINLIKGRDKGGGGGHRLCRLTRTLTIVAAQHISWSFLRTQGVQMGDNEPRMHGRVAEEKLGVGVGEERSSGCRPVHPAATELSAEVPAAGSTGSARKRAMLPCT